MEGRRAGGEGPWDEAEMEVVEGNALRGGAWGEEKGRGRRWRRYFSGRKSDGRKLRTRRRGRRAGGTEMEEEGDIDETLRRARAEIRKENKEMIARRVARMWVEWVVSQGGGTYGRMPSTWW